MREFLEDCCFWLATATLGAIVWGWAGFAVVVGVMVLLLVDDWRNS